MQLSDAGARFIANFEGFRSRPYWDHSHYSIGYGTRARSKSDGPITRAQAADRLRRQVNGTYGKAVDELNRDLRLKLNQNQFDALTSFVFNLGPGVLHKSSSVGRELRQHDFRGAADAMLAYDRAGGQVLPGLTRRRQAERRLFLKRPPVGYSDAERLAFRKLKSGTTQQKRDARAWLERQAIKVRAEARKDGRNGWKKHDRGRRYQGIRRRLRS